MLRPLSACALPRRLSDERDAPDAATTARANRKTTPTQNTKTFILFMRGRFPLVSYLSLLALSVISLSSYRSSLFRAGDFRAPAHEVVDVERHALALHLRVAAQEFVRQRQSRRVVLEVCEDPGLGARLLV